MRVQSGRPSNCSLGGWLHPLGTASQPVSRAPVEPEIRIDAAGMWQRWRLDPGPLAELADDLGVTWESLDAIGCCYAREFRAWAFPMRGADGNICGIRLRDMHGNKWAVKGSRQGVFVPNVVAGPLAWIVEGVSDLAAALDLGLTAIGRPSCQGCLDVIKSTIQRLGVRRVVVASDNDTPGYAGAEILARHVGVPCCLIVPPAKDLRDYLRDGGNRETLEYLVRNTVWQTHHM